MATGDTPQAGGSEQLTTSSQAASGDGIQATADGGRIPLPPIPATGPVAVPESLLRRIRRLDGFLALLVLVLAFLCASFKASNPDIFFHFASGRELAGGERGVTSFLAPKAGVSQSWLFDLGAYLIFTVAPWGGVALVVLKALAVAATAGFMLRAGSRPGDSIWVPAVLTFLGVLTLTLRAALEPTIVSMLMLAMTMFILARAKQDSRSLWLLPVLCLVWVNFDAWFFLGPMTILLFLVGQVMQAGRGGLADSPTPARLALVLVASLAACVANPLHVNAFGALPPGLIQTGAMSEFKSDPYYGAYFLSPFDYTKFLTPTFGLSASGLAYFVLLALGLLSFGLALGGSLDGLRWWRVLIWLAAAGLSSWTYRAIPFFAIVAAPITALNLLELARGGEGFARDSARRWAVSGRVFTAFVGSLGALVAIPGWLQAIPHYRRQVGWGVEVDPGLRDACLRIKSWRELEGGYTGQNWFNTSRDAAYYLAWFCPGESTYVDARLHLFAPFAKEYVSLRKSFTGEGMGNDPNRPPEPAWRKIFAERDVRFVLFHSIEPNRSPTALITLLQMYANPDEFAPCFIEGTTAVFAWRESGTATPLAPGVAEDFKRLAFGPSAVKAPPEPVYPQPLPWWREWWDALQGEGPTPPGSLTAFHHKTRFDALQQRYVTENRIGFFGSQMVSIVGLSAAPGGPLTAGVPLPLRLLTADVNAAKSPLDHAAREIQSRYLQRQDNGPPSSLYLAVRGGREGLRDSPEDVLAQQYLAESYGRLMSRTRESSRISGLVPIAMMIRQAQVAAALNGMLKVKARPDQQREAHLQLVDAYREPRYFELRVKHLREYVRVSGQSMKTPEQAEQLKQAEAMLKEWTTQLKKQRDQYEVQSHNKSVLERAGIAIENGLAETALNLLLRADLKDLADRNNPLEQPGLTLEMSLLLATGRVDEARVGLNVRGESAEGRSFGMHPLGLPAYELLLAQYGAATGDYDLADRALADCLAAVTKVQPYFGALVEMDLVPTSYMEKQGDAATAAAMIVGSSLLHEARQASGLPWQILRHLPYRLNPPTMLKVPGFAPVLFQGSEFFWRINEQQANLWTVRGWLALEAGRIEQAKEYAQKAISLSEWDGPGGERVSRPFRSRPLADLVLQLVDNKSSRD